MIEDGVYAKIYDYAFEKARDVRLAADNSWSRVGIWYTVWARLSEHRLDESFANISPVWWGRRSATITQMRVYIPNMVLEMRNGIIPKSNNIIEVGQDECVSELKCMIGKSICKCLKLWNGLRITLGRITLRYDTVTLLDASSIEELLVALDLDYKPII